MDVNNSEVDIRKKNVFDLVIGKYNIKISTEEIMRLTRASTRMQYNYPGLQIISP